MHLGDHRSLCARILLAGMFPLIAASSYARAEDAKPAMTFAVDPAEIARFKDRSTPRRTLESFWFAIYCYDETPALIVNALDCLDLGGLDPEMRERDAALMAHQLNFITTRLDIPLFSVPEKPVTDQVKLTDVPGFHLVLQRQPDGSWRFDRETIAGIARMRGLVAEQYRQVQDARLKMSQGRTDPETTMRSFLGAVKRRNFADAAQCLDLRDVPPKLRADKGPEIARKLAFVIQRCGFVFPQEIPSDPAGFRYVWHSNHRGRIFLERVRMPDDKDAWLFARGTIQNLDALVKGFREIPPDPRYAHVGGAIDERMLAVGNAQRVPAPADVPMGLASPRSTLRTFLEAMDDLEFEEGKAHVVLTCLDLRETPKAERNAIGLRVAAKLEAILRRIPFDLLSIPDSWEGEPLVLGRETEWHLSISRGPDGAWRFDQDSVARIPELFERLTPEEKIARDARSSFHSARQTMRTMLHAVNTGDLETAASCLDLDAIPSGARAELGGLLATKLKFIIDRFGPVVIQEIPDEPAGPRFYYYRGPLGRIDLLRCDTGQRRGDWQFSGETVGRLETMYRLVQGRQVDPALASMPGVRTAPAFAVAPGLWIRDHTPRWLQSNLGWLDIYQWLGLAMIVVSCAIVAWLSSRAATAVCARLMRLATNDVRPDFLRQKLRPLALQIALWTVYETVRLLDLPVVVFSAFVPLLKVTWVALLAWTMLGLIDLVMSLYHQSERLNHQRNLSDMIVPTAVRALKLVVLLSALAGQVYMVGNGESLARLLAGLGLVGLAASLAAQDTLKNFFGTLLLIGEHPFRIGDLIIVNGMEGTVESVGFRSTRIRTPEDSLLTIPNAVIANASIDNRGARTSRRLRMVVPLAHGTPVERVVALRDALRDVAQNHPRVRRDKIDVHLHTLGTNAIDLLFNVYLFVPNATEELQCRDEFGREILRLAASLGIELGSPSTTSITNGMRLDAPTPALTGPHHGQRVPNPTPARNGNSERH
ncbi:MAG: mechanosensitive ion channel family protein [Isosphaeraceae bacterium]